MIKISYSGKIAAVAGAILPPLILFRSPINNAKIQSMLSLQIPYTITLISDTLYSLFKKQIQYSDKKYVNMVAK